METTAQNIDEILDILWSRLIKVMHPYCWFPNCGKKTEESCHIMKRRHRATRWKPDNGIGGCQFHNQWEEAHTAEAEELIRKYVGNHQYDSLMALSKKETHFTFSDKLEIESRIISLLEEYGACPKVKGSFKKVQKSKYKKDLERFKEKNGGLSPSQVQYRRAKKWKESVDN